MVAEIERHRVRIGVVTDDSWERDVVQSQRLVLVEFSTAWSSARYLMESALGELAETLGKRLKVVRMDINENRFTAAHYGVRNNPTVLVFCRGELVGGFIGTHSRIVLARRLAAILEEVNACDRHNETHETPE